MSNQPLLYRIRAANVEVCNGERCWTERRLMAERAVWVLRIFRIWWPVTNGEWRRSIAEARADAGRDAELRLPIASPLVISIKESID